jgi:hypothetical protein
MKSRGGGLAAGVEGSLLLAPLAGFAEFRQQVPLIRRVPLAAQVLPLLVLLFNERNLVGAPPALHLLSPLNAPTIRNRRDK